FSSSAPPRATSATFAPWPASSRASAAPSPRLAPVTSAAFPVRPGAEAPGLVHGFSIFSSLLFTPHPSVRRLGDYVGERANILASCPPADMQADLAERLAKNVRELRRARGLTQNQMAKISGLPRATWANLESGAANPTLAVLHGVALALQVPIEELLGAPRAG